MLQSKRRDVFCKPRTKKKRGLRTFLVLEVACTLGRGGCKLYLEKKEAKKIFFNSHPKNRVIRIPCFAVSASFLRFFSATYEKNVHNLQQNKIRCTRHNCLGCARASICPLKPCMHAETTVQNEGRGPNNGYEAGLSSSQSVTCSVTLHENLYSSRKAKPRSLGHPHTAHINTQTDTHAYLLNTKLHREGHEAHITVSFDGLEIIHNSNPQSSQ